MRREMKTLLRIDASARQDESHSRALADYYEARWRNAHPDGRVVTRNLTAEPVPHLDPATVAVLYTGGEAEAGPTLPGIAVSDMLIGELLAADVVVVSSAVYNFNMPSSLKAWIDHIVRFGRTIERRGPAVAGLLGGRSACLLTARGGNAQTSPDFQGPSILALFQYLGFSSAQWVSLEGTKIPDGRLDERIVTAHRAIDEFIDGREMR